MLSWENFKTLAEQEIERKKEKETEELKST